MVLTPFNDLDIPKVNSESLPLYAVSLISDALFDVLVNSSEQLFQSVIGFETILLNTIALTSYLTIYTSILIFRTALRLSRATSFQPGTCLIATGNIIPLLMSFNRTRIQYLLRTKLSPARSSPARSTPSSAPKTFLRVLLGKPFRSRVIKSHIGKPDFITTALITPSELSI